MKPERLSPAHASEDFAELVCSNSLRANTLGNAVGLLKEEMRRLGSLVLSAAEATAVPAGKALAVDRVRFSRTITEAIEGHPLIEIVRERVVKVPDDRPVIGDGAADGRGPRRRSRARPRRGVPLLLRRDQSDDLQGFDRRIDRVPGLPLRHRRRSGGRLPERAALAGRVRGPRGRAARGGDGAAASLRGRDVLRGLPPDRGDGAAGSRPWPTAR